MDTRDTQHGNQARNIIPLNGRTACLTAAVDYATKRGWSVFPAKITRDGAKKSHKSAKYSDGAPWGMTKDPEQVARDFKKFAAAAIGVPTGRVNGIFVIEADTLKGHAVNGLASLKRLQAAHGELPPTLMAESPSGSVHRYFKHPGGHVTCATSIAGYRGVDIKGDGGMVIAPPSLRDGRAYRWLNDLPIADAPDWLIDLVRTEREPPLPNGHDNDNPFERYGERFTRVPLETVRATVAAIPNDFDDRQQWVDIGHAIKHAAGDSAEGFGIFLEFSSRWTGRLPPNWAAYTKSAWDGFKPDGRKTFGSLSFLSREKIGVVTGALMQTSGVFVGNYEPPEYLIDGLFLRRNVYSMTAPPGTGKTAICLLVALLVATGAKLGNREVERGRVLFFAGENPDDIRMRWIKLCEEYGHDPAAVDVVFMPYALGLSEPKVRERIDAEAATHGPFSLLVVDTSAAYFSGNDENSNVELGNHARTLRSFVGLPGGPTVLVTCHPNKNYDPQNLQPRGGSAFLAEVDGNLGCVKDPQTMVVEVAVHCGKFRGPEFAPFSFKLIPAQSDKLIDAKGRRLWTVYTRVIDSDEQEKMENASVRAQDQMLSAMLDYPNLSLTQYAERLDWRLESPG